MIYIPNKIKVGYQNRKGTYAGKLAYVIYFDAQGKLRKEASWSTWRDESIDPDEFDNEPTEGFVLNKKAGDYSTDWNHRKAYCRVYDPRGFEFEITIDNLVYILENASCIKGKGLDGEFVYSWDGKDLVLMPVSSPDYQMLKSNSDQINKNECIKSKDLIEGHTYRTKDGNLLCYLGKRVKYEYTYDGEYNIKSKKKCFVFYNPDSKYRFEMLKTWLSFPKTIFIEHVGEDYKNYTKGIQTMMLHEEFTPVDHSKTKFVPADEWKIINDRYWPRFYIKKDDEFIHVEVRTSYGPYMTNYVIRECVRDYRGGRILSNAYSSKQELVHQCEPYCKALYFENGTFFKHIY